MTGALIKVFLKRDDATVKQYSLHQTISVIAEVCEQVFESIIAHLFFSIKEFDTQS